MHFGEGLTTETNFHSYHVILICVVGHALNMTYHCGELDRLLLVEAVFARILYSKVKASHFFMLNLYTSMKHIFGTLFGCPIL